jgi:hypothetical protein
MANANVILACWRSAEFEENEARSKREKKTESGCDTYLDPQQCKEEELQLIKRIITQRKQKRKKRINISRT